MRRWVALAIGFAIYLVVLILVGTAMLGAILDPPVSAAELADWADSFLDALDEDWIWGYMGTCALLVASTQVLFLLPAVRRRPPAGTRPRGLNVSLVLGAAVAALLTMGLAAGVCELAASIWTGRFRESPWPGDGDLGSQPLAGIGVLLVLPVSWVFWSGVLLVFTRQLWADRALGRLVTLLLGGTLLELLVLLPIDVMVRRRTDCYCNTGSFLGLCAGAMGVLWLAGPAGWLLMTGKRRRRWRAAFCGRCGHHRGPSPGDRCPECGHAWRGMRGTPRSAGDPPGRDSR